MLTIVFASNMPLDMARTGKRGEKIWFVRAHSVIVAHDPDKALRKRMAGQEA